MALLLKVENLCCQLGRGQIPALHGVDLTLEAGEFVFIAGRSGAGKSTLARCLCGLIPRVFPGRVEGRVELAEAPLETLASGEIAQRIGVVFQDPTSQLFTDTVEEEVAFGPENLGLPRSEIVSRVEWALTTTGLTGLRPARNETLSMGEKQKLALASVLALRPSVLVLDEPTCMLDETSALAILEQLSRLAREANVAVVVLEHRVRYIAPHATRLVILQGGTITYDGSPDRIRQGRFCTAFGLRSDNNLRSQAPRPAEADAGTPRIASGKDISFAYRGGRPILSDVNVDVFSGAGTVISGPNGSGKTTLLKIFGGLLRPTGGQVWQSVYPVSGARPRLGNGIAFVGQEPAYLFRRGEVEQEYALWQGETGGGQPSQGFLKRLDLWELRHRHPLSLSEGEKRRLSIAAALAARPRMLLLDEPSVGFDGYHLDQLFEVMEDYTKEGGGLLIASNDPDLLERDWPCRLELRP